IVGLAVGVVVEAVRALRAMWAARAVVGLVVSVCRRAARIVREVDLAVAVVVDAVAAFRQRRPVGHAAVGRLAVLVAATRDEQRRAQRDREPSGTEHAARTCKTRGVARRAQLCDASAGNSSCRGTARLT